MSLIIVNGIDLKEKEYEAIQKTIHKMNRKRKENGEKKIEFVTSVNGRTMISRDLWFSLKK